MRSLLIVISSPGRNNFFRVRKVAEPVLVETLIPQLAVEAFNISILGRLARLNQ